MKDLILSKGHDHRKLCRDHMKASRIAVGLTVALVTAGRVPGATTAGESNAWSVPTNGLQARLTLVERPKINGTRLLVPYLELRNVRDLANPMEIQCDNHHLKIELVDADGKSIGVSGLPRSGSAPDLREIILPLDSSIRISLECKNWAIPKDAAAMVSTDSGAWVIQQPEKGKVYIRATLTGEKTELYYRAWYGTVQTPLLKVDWR